MVHHHRTQHKTLKPTLIFGSLLLTLTGIFPERYDANNRTGGYLGLLYYLHLLGVFGSGTLLLGVPYGWFLNHWRTHRWAAQVAHRVPLRSVLARSTYFATVVGFGIAMLVSSSMVDDEVAQMCPQLTTRSDCEQFPLLPAKQCAEARACVEQPTLSGCEEFQQPNFACAWMPSVALNNWTRAIAPHGYTQASECVRSRCPLYQYARGVALEFAVLLLTLCYVSVFGLHDVKRLLDRPASGVGRSRKHLDASVGRSGEREGESQHALGTAPLVAVPMPQAEMQPDAR